MRRPTSCSWFRLLGLAATVLAAAAPASAHLPYEELEAVIHDESGRELHVFRSYVDGIVRTDPVKLVVRDTADRTLAETDYGRDLAVICDRTSCSVFRYDGLMPVFPIGTWRLDKGQLQPARSATLTVLGLVAPLWTHASGYLLAFALLCMPLAICWSLWPITGSPWRIVLFFGTVIATLLGLPLWLYAVVFLSYLSLPWTIVVTLVGAGLIYFLRWTALRLGLPESRMRRIGRVAIAGFALLSTLAVVARVLVVGYWSWKHDVGIGTTFHELPVQPPLLKAMVTRHRGTASEVFVTLAQGVKLADVVNLQLFDGFEAQTTADDAVQRLGPPSGRAEDRYAGVTASYYDRPDGRVSLPRRGASDWTTVGYPARCTHDYVFKDARVRDQIIQWLPPTESIQVNVLRDAGWGGLTVWMSRTGCEYLILTARDSALKD